MIDKSATIARVSVVVFVFCIYSDYGTYRELSQETGQKFDTVCDWGNIVAVCRDIFESASTGESIAVYGRQGRVEQRMDMDAQAFFA